MNLEDILKTKKNIFFSIKIKNNLKRKILAIGKKIKKICSKYKVKFLINDDPELAKKINADGCHIGQKGY